MWAAWAVVNCRYNGSITLLRIRHSEFRTCMSSRPANRREFLQGKAAVQAAQELVDHLVEEPPQEDQFDAALGDSYLVRIGRRAMACEFEVLLNAGQYANGSAAALVAASDLIDRLEGQMTVYRDDSEISELNARAFDDPVEVEPLLFAVLERGIELYRETQGGVRPDLGSAVESMGILSPRGESAD